MFSKCDLRSRYHQVHIKEEEIYKTSFLTRYGKYEFFVVPFCLTNAIANFMCLMNSLGHPNLERFLRVFIDDILIYLNNEEDHEEHLETLFTLLIENQLHAKLSKCSFFLQKKGTLLGTCYFQGRHSSRSEKY